MSVTVYKKTALTGGGASALDGINGSSLLDGDLAFVTVGNVFYAFILDDDSGATESSPDVIAPDTNPGTKRWIMQAMYPDLFNYITQSGVTRLTHSFSNFLANSGVESWQAGTSVAPDCWYVVGATVARSATAASGTYSAAVTYTDAGQTFAGSIGNFGRYGDYTFSFYYQCTQAAGGCGARAVIQENEDDYTELASVYLDNTVDGVWRLAVVSVTVDAGHWGKASRFGINSSGTGETKWLFDEFQVQEGLNLATTWHPAPIWDHGGGQYLFQSLYSYCMNTFGYAAAITPTAYVDIIGEPGLRIRTSTPPVAANSTGNKGQIEWDDTYLYLCVDTDTWVTFKKDISFKP